MTVKASTEKLKQYFYDTFKNNDYETTLLNLKSVNQREKIINELAENQEEAYLYNEIYERVLKNISAIFKNNDDYIKAQKEKELQRQIEQIKQQTGNEHKQEKDFKIFSLIPTWIKILIITIISIILLLVIGYFAFAKPVFNEASDLGYEQFETVRVNPETGEKIPKNEVYKYYQDN